MESRQDQQPKKAQKGVISFIKSLSGRVLMLTIGFVLLADIMIFVPSVARYRADFLLERLRQAQIAALVQLASDVGVSPELEAELLANAEVYNVVLRRDDIRQLVLSSPVPAQVTQDYDLRNSGPWTLIRDAAAVFLEKDSRIIRVIGNPVQEGGQLIEITMNTDSLRQGMVAFSFRILWFSALISLVAAVILFLVAQRFIVVPIQKVLRNMRAFADAPQDARNLIVPSGELLEIRQAEEVLSQVQLQLTAALRQKERLAQLGGAVAKINHDLRNILTTAQLFADRMEGSSDPMVIKSAPKLVASISRAVSLCESTLAFGRAEEAPPQLLRFGLSALVQEITEGEGLPSNQVACLNDIAPSLMLRADREQLYRVISNLLRNARQALEATGEGGTIEISAAETESHWWIKVGDSGPGMPPKARENLFAAFQGGVRKGGTGLGLAIAAELVRGHGGKLELLRSDSEGTEFMIWLPKEVIEENEKEM